MNLKYFNDDFTCLKLFTKTYYIPIILGFLIYFLSSFIFDFNRNEILDIFMSTFLLLIVMTIVTVILSFIYSRKDKITKNNGIKTRYKISNINTFLYKWSNHGCIEFKKDKDTIRIVGIYPNKDFYKLKEAYNHKKDFYIDIYEFNGTYYADLKSIKETI